MRHNETKKIHKGGFGWFSSKKDIEYTGKNDEIKKDIEKFNLPNETNYKKLIIPKKVQDNIVAVETLQTVGTLGNATAIAVGSTGIGLPVAGLMAVALLLTNKMIEIYKYNLLLQLLMQDATFIIMDSYLLYELIDKSYQILNKYEDPNMINCDKYNQKDATSSDVIVNEKDIKIKKFQINRMMQQQLKYQIEKLIKELLSLSNKETIYALEADPILKNTGINFIISTEANKRRSEYKYGLGKFNRNLSKKFYGEYYITNINNSLTIINSYIILLKSNLDLTIKKFEILENDKYKEIWKTIICSPEYNAYIKPILSEILKDAVITSKEVDSNALEKELQKVQLGDTGSEENSNTKGGYKFKRRFKRKTFKRK